MELEDNIEEEMRGVGVGGDDATRFL